MLLANATAAMAQPEPDADAPAPEPAAPPAPAAAPPMDRKPLGLTLRRCLELAERNYPKIHEARAKLAIKRAQLDQAHYTPFSDFTVTGGFSLAPEVQGTSVYSPNSDVPLTPDLGVGWQIGIDGLIPLWTFGKITNLWDAAEAQVKVGEHELQKEKNQLRFDVRRAYYGIRLARDALALVKDGIQRLDKYIPDLEKKVAAGEGDDIELLKVRMSRAELDARESEARKQEAIATSGLRFLTGVSAIVVPDLPLARVQHRLGPLSHYLSAARLYRPEVNMAKAGVLAREAQLRVERARYLPDIGLGLNARWSSAPSITDQTNPFIRDPNYLTYGAGLVFRYKLDFLPQSTRVEQAEAQLEEIRATERFALGGVGWEVESAFREAEDATRRLDAYTRATTYARQWLVKVQQGIEVGTFEDEDIVDPAKEYALKRFSQMSALFDYNVALAKLAQVTGWDTVAGDE
ncbi:MAG TPA: TolC family protein [Polyangiaceae bacterium]|nr:TolC family protein [Polyangiaceae bacterium]